MICVECICSTQFSCWHMHYIPRFMFSVSALLWFLFLFGFTHIFRSSAKWLYLFSKFTEVCWYGSSWRHTSDDSNTDWVPNRRQAFIWTKIGMVYWRIYVSFALDGLISWSTFMAAHHNILLHHDDVFKWNNFPRNWPFVRGIHRSSVNSPHKDQWRGALMLSLICAQING